MLHNRELVALLPDYTVDEMGISCVYLSRKQMPAAVRVFLDFLTERFAEWERELGH